MIITSFRPEKIGSVVKCLHNDRSEFRYLIQSTLAKSQFGWQYNGVRATVKNIVKNIVTKYS